MLKDTEKNLFRNFSAVICVAAALFFSACSTHHKITTIDSPSTRRTDITQQDRHSDSKKSSTTPLRDSKAQRYRYIEQYRQAAIANRNRYGIPAAITLGQGLLESAGGTSFLAQNGNNHFGIKASRDWTGPSLCKPGENVPYRKYDRVEDCFADHARFLMRKRYAPLFKLDITDYKGWARTLKSCGYATDPRYAEKLIQVIEQYELHLLDK